MVLQPLQHHIALQSQQRITKKDKKKKLKLAKHMVLLLCHYQ